MAKDEAIAKEVEKVKGVAMEKDTIEIDSVDLRTFSDAMHPVLAEATFSRDLRKAKDVARKEDRKEKATIDDGKDTIKKQIVEMRHMEVTLLCRPFMNMMNQMNEHQQQANQLHMMIGSRTSSSGPLFLLELVSSYLPQHRRKQRHQGKDRRTTTSSAAKRQLQLDRDLHGIHPDWARSLPLLEQPARAFQHHRARLQPLQLLHLP